MSVPFPQRKAILSTFKNLLRSSNPVLQSRRSRTHTLSSAWTTQVVGLYRANKDCADAKTAWKLHTMATECLSMHTSNTAHANAMFEAGWCLNKPQVAQVKNVAGYVGLDMPVVYGADSLVGDASITIDTFIASRPAAAAAASSASSASSFSTNTVSGDVAATESGASSAGAGAGVIDPSAVLGTKDR